MGLLSGRLGLKKLAFLQEHDDRFSTSAPTVPETVTAFADIFSAFGVSCFIAPDCGYS
jgi:hypothetical protein